MAASMLTRLFVNKIRISSNLVARNCLNAKPLQASHWRCLAKSAVVYSSDGKPDLPPKTLKQLMESLTDKFAEARELLSDARESQGTVYFSEDMEDAQQAVEETLQEYQDLQGRLSDKQRQQLVSTLGLRMEELKAQQSAIEEALKD